LSRFVFQRGHFDETRVKYRAFEPPSRDFTLSVSRTHNLTEPEIWQHGDQWVATPGRAILARGDFTLTQVKEVFVEGFLLSVSPDEPPERHANVVGWPPSEQKELRRSLAQQLAAKARCVPRV
jgi:hypothetical protein